MSAHVCGPPLGEGLARFDRYVLSQLVMLFGFFALVLVAVYWINHAIQLFDELIADGHSARVFLEFTLLSLPQIIALVLPMAGFAAAVYMTNRLANDSELTVVQATGFSSLRVARSAVMFGLLLTLMSSVLIHVLVPVSAEQLKFREREISGSVSARLLREGVFLHPVDGVTFYIREISTQGELRDVFLSDLRDTGRQVTYTAQRAYLLRDEAGPKLVMVDGVAQTYDETMQTLSTTNFGELVRDVSGLVLQGTASRRKLEYVPTWEFFDDVARVAEEANRTPAHVWKELHWRLAQPLLCLVAVLIGQSSLLASGFSRFGVTKQVVAAVGLLVLIKLVEGAITDPVEKDFSNWPLNYLPALVGFVIAGALYWRADHPHARLWPSRAPREPAA
ncbi:LPS export ABC transporter permease LptF [Primorskyibacter sp. S187A]|uniref:LPS export ABC transporter permease LptF n=1 Tax=Primorskyibacter sp. S187A TaxID=3415130 RepID=UPI003C7C2B7D